MGDTDREWAMRQHPGLVDSNQIIDLEPEVDLEFKVYTIKWIDGAGPVDPHNKHSQEVEKILNDGWQLDDKIISPPFVMLIFSREKEEVKE